MGWVLGWIRGRDFCYLCSRRASRLGSETFNRFPSLMFEMALETDYGVLAGTVQSADLQNPSGGQWPDGWTKLAQTSTSGALDYVRRPGLTGTQIWTLQNGDNLINQLVYLLSGVQRIHFRSSLQHRARRS